MSEAFLQKQTEQITLSPNASYIHELFDKAEKILLEHRLQNPGDNVSHG